MSIKPKSLSEIDFKPVGKVFPSPSDWRDQEYAQKMGKRNFFLFGEIIGDDK